MSLTVEKCLQAWTNSLRQMNAKADIVFFGDSLTYYGDFSSTFPDEVVCNLGLRGDTIQGMIERVEQVKLLQPKSVYVMAGINNVKHNSKEEFKSWYSILVDTLLHSLSGVRLVIQSILPVNSENFHISCDNNQINVCNGIIERIAIERDLQYLDLFSKYIVNNQLPRAFTQDGIHLIPTAYKCWYRLIQ